MLPYAPDACVDTLGMGREYLEGDRIQALPVKDLRLSKSSLLRMPCLFFAD